MRTRLRSRILRHLIGAALAVVGCRSTATPEVTIEAALAHYASLAAAMQHDSIAALFTPDGELATEGQPAITGPEAIRAHLHSFVGYHVLSNELVANTTRASADSADQAGTFRQRVQVPAGDTVSVQGRFTIRWIRDRAGAWRIQRMATRPPA
jgi:uncharacterized protein (TIGR02246 family)